MKKMNGNEHVHFRAFPWWRNNIPTKKEIPLTSGMGSLRYKSYTLQGKKKKQKKTISTSINI
jgi:hypothetical protein